MTAPATLDEALRQRIRATGPITIAEYMADALGHPRWGYYATRDPFGAQGDFVTAPEISQLFGEMIGLWCVDFWRGMGSPNPFHLVELGPGRGTLMADALRAAKVAPAFSAAMRLHLVETSPALRGLQATTLAGIAEPVWHDHMSTVPPGPMLLVANEFLDALPIRQLERLPGGWHERRVGVAADDRLTFMLDPAPSPLARALPPAARDAEVGSVIELCPAAQTLAATLGARVVADGGAALFIDYGYARSACGDTLQALRAHKPHDPLIEPGSADLTAHVDFASFAAAARSTGARIYGPVSQGAFLTTLGIGVRAKRLRAGATPAQTADIDSARHRLIDPAQMGTLFKAVALTRRALPAPAGFPPPSDGG